MKKIFNTRQAFGVACSLGLALGLAGTVMARPAAHDAIQLKDAAGVDIPAGSTAAYSSKQTCGTAGCHDYGQIERHSSHAQLAANGIDGWSAWNPTSKNGDIKGCNYYAKQFTQTYGHLGKWCGVSNRQQARLFDGVSATDSSNWNPMTGQFKESINTNAPGTGKGFQFFDYTSAANMALRTDLTVAGLLQECNECHVGGGAMEYLPAGGTQFTSALLALNSRTSLRSITTGTPNAGAPITADKFTTFNYFRDTRDLDRDGNKSDMVYNDYAKTGVGEVDCLMCHLEGYNWEHRKDEIVKAKHDTARAVGAGIATTNALQWAVDGEAPDGYGTTVGAYNATKVAPVGGVLKLTSAFADGIKKSPPSDNCVACHMGTGYGIDDDHDGHADGPSKVDVKKRGDHWLNNTNWDVHSSALECMDCHNNSTNEGSRDAGGNLIYDANGLTDSTGGKTGAVKSSVGFVDLVDNNTGAATPDGLDDNNATKVYFTGPDAGKLGMCDPGHKSGSFTGVWNAKDSNIDATSCTTCHGKPDGTYEAAPYDRHNQYKGAVNPFAKHAAAGLTATNVQDPYDTATRPHTPGVANATHLDIISCTACHVRKLEHYAGGALLDATGTDSLGHMGDHENKFTLRDMNDNLTVLWYKGKIMKSNVQGAYLWTDNNAATSDANKDGMEGGMDFLLPTHIAQVNIASGRDTGTNGASSLTDVKHGVISTGDISERQMDIMGNLGLWPQMNFMQQQFVVEHGVSRANVAWGAKGCIDCHAPYTEVGGVRTAGGFYNGAYKLKAKEGTFEFSSGFVNGYGEPAGAGMVNPAAPHHDPMDPMAYGSQPNYMQVAPFYMVNNMTGPTDFHPYLYERGTKFNDSNKLLRSLAVDVTSSYEAYGPRTVRDIDRSEMLYENAFMKLKTAPSAGFLANGFSVPGGTITGAPIYVPNAAQGDSNRGYMIVVQTKDEGAADSTAVKHVLMKPMNNADGESVATLIGQFSMMWDGDPTPAATHTTPYGFSLADAGSNRLSIIANAGKQIKIFDTIGRFGFGFAGYYVAADGMHYDPAADAIYEQNPTIGTKGGAYATRTAWVNYLDGIGAPGAAVIATPAVAPPATNAAVAGTALTFTANTTGHVASSTLYKWDMGNGMVFETEKDANGQPLTTHKHNNGTPTNTADDVTGLAGNASSVSYAYPVTGQFTAQLFVMNSNGGGQTSDSAIVAVGSPVATPTWTAAWSDNSTPAVLTDDQMQLAGLPADWTKIYVVWDDGTKTNVTTGAGSATANILHAYRLIAQRQVGGTHVFNPTIRVYNGTTLLGTRKVTVTTTP